MTAYKVWCGSWKTAKTTTHEMAIGTRFGFMSIRVVVNGKKVDIYTGFDPVYHQDDLPELMIEDGLPSRGHVAWWRQSYIEGIRRSAEKWSGDHHSEDPYDVHGIYHPVDWFDADVAALVKQDIQEGQANLHWRMLLGEIPGVASSSRAAAKPAEDAVNLQAAAQASFLERCAADPLYGTF